MNLPAPQFQTIQEQDQFLALFPHRYDYIWAEHPEPGASPDWKTESRHPLSDRLVQQGAYLYGVRFGKTTRYLLLDLDCGGLYHPAQDPFAIRRILAVLEPLNLVAWVAVSSSYSGGLHLYFPFLEEQDSWAIAQAVQVLLEQAGFKLAPGHLELFPNPRAYSENPGLYLAHRLPLQTGSYLLNEEFQPIYGTQATFVHQWHHAQSRNTLTRATLDRVLKQKQRKRYRLSSKASKFLNDLNAEIEPGWTAPGQTNHLLARITMREYIFGHISRGCEPLVGEDLADAICETARSLPGFQDYCSHQHDLERRVMWWVRSIQASHYYPFGSKNQPNPTPAPVMEPTLPSWNQQQSQEARDRIRQAVTDLLSRNALPVQTTARRHAIRAYGIGNPTLDKYKELWHPEHLKPNQDNQYHPIESLDANSNSFKPNQDSQYHSIHTNKLVPNSAAPQGQADGFSDVGGCGGFSTAMQPAEVAPCSDTQSLLAKMQAWLESEDPILKAEAEQYFAAANRTESSRLKGDEVELEQPTSCSAEEGFMPGGFGKTQAKRRSGKAGLQEIRQLSPEPTSPAQDSQLDLVLQAQVAVSFAQYRQENPEDLAIAWSIGVYNPLAQVDLLAVGARFLEPEEEDWLALARMVGWLEVEDDLDAIYFTAPPPDFALEQADWYVRPDLTSFLDEPVLLRAIIQQHPVSLTEIQGAIAQRFLQLGWTSQQQAQLVQQLFEKPEPELKDDWEFLLFELDSQVQNRSE